MASGTSAHSHCTVSCTCMNLIFSEHQAMCLASVGKSPQMLANQSLLNGLIDTPDRSQSIFLFTSSTDQTTAAELDVSHRPRK